VLIDAERCGVERDAFLDAMTSHGIGVGVHYIALTEHPYYQEQLGWRPEDTPHATRIGRQIVSLPISAKLSDVDVGDVIEAVQASLGLSTRPTLRDVGAYPQHANFRPRPDVQPSRAAG